jgi:ATP-dependent helicase/nuclease subunit B
VSTERALLITSHAAHVRIERARAWLAARAPAAQALVVAATPAAAADLTRTALGTRAAAFGWHHLSLPQLAAALASHALVTAGLVAISRLAASAVVARAAHDVARAGSLGRYAPVAETPGFARAAARAIEDLRLARIEPAAIAAHDADLAALLAAYEAALEKARLTDWPGVLALAHASVAHGNAHPLLDLPLLLLDVAPDSEAEADLVAAIAARAPATLATLPEADRRGRALLARIDGVAHEPAEDAPATTNLARLQRELFAFAPAAAPAAAGDDVGLYSAPGESRECVEIARAILAHARAGVPFDRMGVLLRAPEAYRSHLEEAFVRAGIPSHCARGARRPDPAGRALLALLACAAGRLSARCFAEYLSLGQVPDATIEGAPPPALSADERTSPPDEEMAPRAIVEFLRDDGDDIDDDAPPVRDAREAALRAAGATSAGAASTGAASVGAAVGAASVGAASRRDSAAAGLSNPSNPTTAPVAAGRLRAPRRWERLLVDAAVIGGRERWARRLDGLRAQLHLDLGDLADEDDLRADTLRRNITDLDALRDFALPLIDALAALPAAATWGGWIDALGALATRSLRDPARVLSVLAELAPMADVGPVPLNEVIRVLAPRLQEVAVPPPVQRGGRVLIAPLDAARGLELDVVFVPGLAERVFPPKIGEDPILLDAVRAQLGLHLVTNAERIARERLGLALAVGAARRAVVLSYPRVDTEQSRARVPSFYALEALRAAEGVLPDFAALAARAESATSARIGWPAPRSPQDAIDEAEHDLALLERLMRRDAGDAAGTARYLLSANPHLGRALRFRARRWLRRWTPADGLVDVDGFLPAARTAIAEHWLDGRSYSPTALQNYAACPYKFLLYAVHRLAPREVPVAIDELDPLQRGSLVHDVLFRFFRRLEGRVILPVRQENLAHAQKILSDVIDEVAAEYADQLAPAIPRVWEDGIALIRADLREWLRRASEDESGFVPWRFELAFGLPGSRARDPQSLPGAVALDCGIQLRGSIDLVERRADGTLRATDHKTGKNVSRRGQVIAGGESLQPVLYALAAEKMFAREGSVASGRLYYCTATGGYAEHDVPLDTNARRAADTVAEVVGGALGKAFLPAAPAKDKCRWCDYLVVCGPHEESRVARKPKDKLEPLDRLRQLP